MFLILFSVCFCCIEMKLISFTVLTFHPIISSYGLNAFPQNSLVKALTANMVVFGSGALGGN